MRVLVTGGRDFTRYDIVARVLDTLHRADGIAMLCHGGARGADELCRQWAHNHEIPNVEYPARWKKDGRAAGPMRNARMLSEFKPNLVVAFPGGRGTLHMVQIAREAGVEVVESVGYLITEEP